MGRTNPTFRDYVDREEDRWSSFRRGLRRHHQDDFDQLFVKARCYADAAGYANPADPHTALVLSILLGQERELRTLRERVDSLEEGESVDSREGGESVDLREGSESSDTIAEVED